ncbi:MAG: hypothetical protein KH452_05000 [Clostridiales bacterium]|nr:hypothetical protein [Clostridiales bacterium]
MTERMLQNRIRKLKELEEQQKELEKQIEELKAEIKDDMEEKGVEQQIAGDYLIRWTMVFSNRFDSKTFQKEHESLYSQYLKQTTSRRFSIA